MYPISSNKYLGNDIYHLFGVDSDAERKAQGGGSRSDTIMILSINPKEKKTE
jgi:anionic cell wall polymer biosynthesis LytR-Cps2A-Psr (LCP) family protein